VNAAKLASEIIERAKRSEVTIVTAESCTAGRIAQLLADAPGAGEYFHVGFVTYTK
jgi:nicotinamide-nucleotide amidase